MALLGKTREGSLILERASGSARLERLAMSCLLTWKMASRAGLEMLQLTQGWRQKSTSASGSTPFLLRYLRMGQRVKTSQSASICLVMSTPLKNSKQKLQRSSRLRTSLALRYQRTVWNHCTSVLRRAMSPLVLAMLAQLASTFRIISTKILMLSASITFSPMACRTAQVSAGLLPTNLNFWSSALMALSSCSMFSPKMTRVRSATILISCDSQILNFGGFLEPKASLILSKNPDIIIIGSCRHQSLAQLPTLPMNAGCSSWGLKTAFVSLTSVRRANSAEDDGLQISKSSCLSALSRFLRCHSALVQVLEGVMTKVISRMARITMAAFTRMLMCPRKRPIAFSLQVSFSCRPFISDSSDPSEMTDGVSMSIAEMKCELALQVSMMVEQAQNSFSSASFSAFRSFTAAFSTPLRLRRAAEFIQSSPADCIFLLKCRSNSSAGISLRLVSFILASFSSFSTFPSLASFTSLALALALAASFSRSMVLLSISFLQLLMLRLALSTSFSFSLKRLMQASRAYRSRSTKTLKTILQRDSAPASDASRRELKRCPCSTYFFFTPARLNIPMPSSTSLEKQAVSFTTISLLSQRCPKSTAAFVRKILSARMAGADPSAISPRRRSLSQTETRQQDCLLTRVSCSRGASMQDTQRRQQSRSGLPSIILYPAADSVTPATTATFTPPLPIATVEAIQVMT